jgi:MarR-like DNA-binding transcriptional regulator SgrR of sgrS sRNA
MKLPRLIALHVGLTAVLLTSSMAVLADTKISDAKNKIIDKQQQMTQEEMDAAKKATPYNEQRPAANTSQEKHSTESPKGSMIKKQMKAVDKATEDATAAKPKVENRPAVTTDYK